VSIIGAIAVILVLTAVFVKIRKQDSAATPNIVVIIMDTARADYFGISGELGSFTATVDEIAGEGVVFNNAFATSSWTLPSHVSLFTGLYPHQHGAVHEHFNVDESLKTMAEILRSRGYATVGVNCNPWLNKPCGIAQGFDVYEEISRKIEYGRDKGAGLCTITAAEWISRYCREGKPFFLFINYLDPHLPFSPPTHVMTTTNSYLNDGEFAFDSFSVEDAESYIAGTTKLTENDLETIRTLYLSEIAYVDEQIGTLVSLFRELDCLDETFMILASDHGEHLGEHNLLGHEFTLFEQVLRIPLIIRYPSTYPPGSIVDTPVSLVDILPTVLELIGDETSYASSSGRSLLHVLDWSDEDERTILSELSRPTTLIYDYWKNKYPEIDMTHYDRGLRALRMGRFKYVVTSRGEEFLFDLEEDPLEENNLVDTHTDEVKKLRSELAKETGTTHTGPGK
jgi:arylsulfatase A-like enzyme